jgi:uncharacterized protein (DUF427 family)
MSARRGAVRTEPSGKRVRVILGGACIVDSDDALYVWESPRYPQYYLPSSAFVEGSLEPSSTSGRHSPSRGYARFFNVHGGNRVALDAAWSYNDSPLPELDGRVRLEWDSMDAWFEEDEEVFVHPRDPSTRVQILPSSRHVVVAVEGIVVAESRHPAFLYETRLPRRTYIPKLDVNMERLEPTATTSQCPYKGTARYWTVETDDALHPDLAWSYPTPRHESANIAGLVAFYDEHVDLTVDGQLQTRPTTHFVIPPPTTRARETRG